MATPGGSRRVARLKARSQAKSDAHATIARKALGDSRVSTDEQAEHGHSLENQERALPRRELGRGGRRHHRRRGRVRHAPPRRARRLRARARARRGRRRLGPPGVKVRPAGLAHAVTTVNDLMIRFNVQLCSVMEPIDTAMGRTLFAVLSGWPSRSSKTSSTVRLTGGRRRAKAASRAAPCPTATNRMEA